MRCKAHNSRGSIARKSLFKIRVLIISYFWLELHQRPRHHSAFGCTRDQIIKNVFIGSNYLGQRLVWDVPRNFVVLNYFKIINVSRCFDCVTVRPSIPNELVVEKITRCSIDGTLRVVTINLNKFILLKLQAFFEFWIWSRVELRNHVCIHPLICAFYAKVVHKYIS